jgi:hypothetical protein
MSYFIMTTFRSGVNFTRCQVPSTEDILCQDKALEPVRPVLHPESRYLQIELDRHYP